MRAAREAYAQAHGFDVRKMVADLQKLDRAGDRPVVRLIPPLNATRETLDQALEILADVFDSTTP